MASVRCLHAWHGVRRLLPRQGVEIESDHQHGLNDLEIRRHIEVARHLQAVVAYMQNLAHPVNMVRGLQVDGLDQRQDRVAHRLETLGDQVDCVRYLMAMLMRVLPSTSNTSVDAAARAPMRQVAAKLAGDGLHGRLQRFLAFFVSLSF
jgi:hypothetical protein